MDLEIARRVVSLYEEGRPAVLCAVVEEIGSTPRSMGSQMLVFPGGRIEGAVGGGITEHRVIAEALALLERGTGSEFFRDALSATEAALEGAACGGAMGIYLEVIGRKRELVIFGAGHVGKAIARLGAICGFSVVVWDERKEFANNENIPWGKTVCCPLDEFFSHASDFPIPGRSR